VVVLSGDDKGKQGKILMSLPDKDKLIVEGVNVVKRHTKPSQRNQVGGIIEKEAPIAASKVAFVEPGTGKKAKLGRQGARERQARTLLQDHQRTGIEP
jgi:large subunit ribosomal protein L24